MPEVKWIKISTGIFDDEKIRLIEAMPDSDTILIIWIKLLALAGRQNDHGQVYLTELTPYNDKMLAHIFNRKEATVKLAMRTFQEFGMIEVLENQTVVISNWGKHQNTDGLEKIRDSGRARVQRFRDKQKALCSGEENRRDKKRIEENVTETLPVTLHKKFVKPTIEEWLSYSTEIGWSKGKSEPLYHYYESNGWKVGKNPMVNWKSCISGAKSRDQAALPAPQLSPPSEWPAFVSSHPEYSAFSDYKTAPGYLKTEFSQWRKCNAS